MSDETTPRMRGERGASLILAIAFLLVVGGIGAAVISTTTSGLRARAVLDTARNREYAADGAIETAIVRVRGNGGVCGPLDLPFTLDGYTIHVDCVSSPTPILSGGTLLWQNDVIFTACLSSAATAVYASGPTVGGVLTARGSTASFLSQGVVAVANATSAGLYKYTGRTGFTFTGVTAIRGATLVAGDAMSQGCDSSNTIINAQINFHSTGSPLTTYVQAWSVNG